MTFHPDDPTTAAQVIFFQQLRYAADQDKPDPKDLAASRDWARSLGAYADKMWKTAFEEGLRVGREE